MKCIRDVGWNKYYAQFDKECRQYKKRFWKKTCPYSRRCRTGVKALCFIKDRSHKAYFLERANFETHFATYEKKRWQ